MSSPVWSLTVDDRLVSRCDDGLLEAEYALFDPAEMLVSSGVGEEGYVTRARFARARLLDGRVTAELAADAFAAMRGRLLRPLARSRAVRDVVDLLGPYETFQGGVFVAGRGHYSGVWLDLAVLAAACPLPDAAILLQVLHLLLVLEEIHEDAPVRLWTSPTVARQGGGGAGARTWRRVDLESAQRLPGVLHAMRAPMAPPRITHDEATVGEEIVRDLRARVAMSVFDQPRLRVLASAIARTSSGPAPSLPPQTGRPLRRMSSAPTPPPIPSSFVTAAPGTAATALAVSQPRVVVARPASTFPYDSPSAARGGLDPRLVLLAEPDSERAAAFRLLRDSLIAKKAPAVIVVSSGAPNQGKTTCAINLALALSERPASTVLLMEGNFFVPSIDAVFHIDAASVTDSRLDADLLSPYRIVQATQRMHVAALVRQAGPPPPSFNGPWFERVIDYVSNMGFDHVVIDAAALDGSLAVAQMVGTAEGTLLTARARATTARDLRRAADQIPEGRALGVALMDA